MVDPTSETGEAESKVDYYQKRRSSTRLDFHNRFSIESNFLVGKYQSEENVFLTYHLTTTKSTLDDAEEEDVETR